MTKFILQFRIFLTLILIVISSNLSRCQRSFQFDPTWPSPSIENLPYHGSGATLDRENNLLVLTRGAGFFPGRNETIRVNIVQVIDQISGIVLREWGADTLYHPHGIESTSNGDIFITDIVLHQVLKFQYIPTLRVWNNNPILTLGQRFVSGNDASRFCEPADVAVERSTEAFYVADGYCNSRVVKFDRYGNYLLQFSAGTPIGVPVAPFRIVHKVVVAVRSSPNRNGPLQSNVNADDVIVVVADRDNCRIQYFNGNGVFLYQQTHLDLGVPNTFLMSVAFANVNAPGGFGIVYASEFGAGGANARPPTIIEIAVGPSNAYVMSRFTSNQSDPFVFRGVLHDLTVSTDGTRVYFVTSNSGALLVTRFRLTGT